MAGIGAVGIGVMVWYRSSPVWDGSLVGEWWVEYCYPSSTTVEDTITCIRVRIVKCSHCAEDESRRLSCPRFFSVLLFSGFRVCFLECESFGGMRRKTALVV